MTWAKVDDTLHAHRKVRLLCEKPDGLAALGLWTLLLSFCARPGRGGLAADDLEHICLLVSVRPKRAARLAALLVDAGLLVESGSGWCIRGRYIGRPAIRPPMRRRIIARDGLRCGICGADVKPNDVHIDHIQPSSRGGKTVEHNLRVTHSLCNIRKGARE